MDHWNRWQADNPYTIKWPPRSDKPDPYEGTWKAAKNWYPEGIEWHDLEHMKSQGLASASPSDIKYVPFFIAAFYFGRIIFERLIGRPLGMYCLGVVSKRTPPEPCSELEAAYKIEKNPGKFTVVPSGWSMFRVKRWYRRRRNADRPDRLKKFEETAYRFFFYITMYLVGQWCISGEEYVAEPYMCWQSLPYQRMKGYIMGYYFSQCAFYSALMLSLFSDIRRKDFYEQIAHHIVTVCLILGSYVLNFWRVGTLLLLYNDLSDWIVEFSKLLVYSRCKKTADCMVVLFAFSWIYTRNYLYATVILHTTLIKPLEMGYQPYFGYYVFNAFLIVLGGLQVFWTCMLFKFAKKLISNMGKKGVEDSRSDPEEYTDDEDDEVVESSILHKKSYWGSGKK